MNQGRPPEGEQVEMFELIEERLKELGIFKYEISNFARPGYESRHNQAYWNDSSYWGLGLSSHSYAPHLGEFGARFWNPKALKEYEQQSELKATDSWGELLPASQIEWLQEHEALTDFCHMHLRTLKGLPEAALRHKFKAATLEVLWPRLNELVKNGLLEPCGDRWTLSTRGQLISNKVFEELTFSKPELALGTLTASAQNSYCSV